MSADVYTLASPTPTLYVYPSALHPQEQTGWRGMSSQTMPPIHDVPAPSRRVKDEEALSALGAL